MHVTVSARHGQLSREHEAQIREKAGWLAHFYDRLTALAVTVDLPPAGRPRVEVIADAGLKHRFVAAHSHADVAAAVHEAFAKMKAQLVHYKEKLKAHRPAAAAVSR